MKILSITESLVEQIRKEIIMGQLPPGAKLNEIELSKRMEVSRPPLREAFRKLEYENLVLSIPRKGTFVSDLSAKDCVQVYHVRCVIECAGIDILAQQGITDLPLVRKAMETGAAYSLSEPSKVHDIMTYFTIMVDFHKKLIEASQNKWLIHCYESIGSTLARYQVMFLGMPGTLVSPPDVHNKVLDLIESREYKKASQYLKKHINRMAQQLIKMMQPDTPV